MKKISEMTLEELQDYALALESDKQTLTDEKHELTAKNEELTGYNQALQKRNNELFLKVEQQITGPDTPDPKEEKTESCEDFAKNLIMGGKI